MTNPLNEFPLATTTVYVDGEVAANLVSVSMELGVGMTPSRAILMHNFGQDVPGPVALQTTPYSYGQRVRIDINRTLPSGPEVTTVFLGWLLKRSDQCKADKVVWQAYDDRILMQWVPVRGCIVYDPIDKTLRYSPRHLTSFNPDGFWNCTGYHEESTGITYPVFTDTALRSQAYEPPNAAYPADPEVGKVSPWTPRRALKYLAAWSFAHAFDVPRPGMTPDHGTIPGLDLTKQSFLLPEMELPGIRMDLAEIAGMVGMDPADLGLPDPLDRKMDSISVQGATLLSAVDSVLKTTGTHSIIVKADEATANSTMVSYAVTGYYPQGIGDWVEIQTGGNVGEVPAATCYDYTFDEDASQVVETALVESDVVRMESELIYVGGRPTGDTDYSEDEESELVPAWTYLQEVAFLHCINGQAPADLTQANYAKIAKVHGDPTTLLICDGESEPGHFPEIIRPRTPEAIQAARDSFPTVFRAWKLNGSAENMQLLLGLNNGGVGGLKGFRPILPEQLQFQVINLGGGEDVSNWMLSHLPIRVQFYDIDGSGDWYEVPKDVSARVTADGLIWLDGLAETASGTSDCVFTGNLFSQDDHRALKIKLRPMSMNCAFPMDDRLISANTVSFQNMSQSIRDAYAEQGAKLVKYKDTGRAFKRSMQRMSSPCRSPEFYGGANGLVSIPNPIVERDVPPGTEQLYVDFEAVRVRARFQRPKREATFYMIGVQPKWLPGARIAYVRGTDPRPGGAKSFTYQMRSPILTVTHDFLKQVTTLGGLLSEYHGG